MVTRQSLVGRVAVAPTNWQLTLAKRKRLEAVCVPWYLEGVGRFYNLPGSSTRAALEKDDFTSRYRGNTVEGGAETSPVSTGKWLGNDAAEFLQSETTRPFTLVSQTPRV